MSTEKKELNPTPTQLTASKVAVLWLRNVHLRNSNRFNTALAAALDLASAQKGAGQELWPVQPQAKLACVFFVRGGLWHCWLHQ